MKHVDILDILEEHPSPWWLYPFIKPGHITLIASEPGVGKSTYLLSALMHIMLKRPFLGNPTAVQCQTAFLVGVDAPRRDYGHIAWKLLKGMGITHPRQLRLKAIDGDLIAKSNFGSNIRFSDTRPKNPIEIANALKTVFNYETPEGETINIRPQILMIDALRQVHPYDENDSRQIGDLMGFLREETTETRAVVATHHLGKAAATYSQIYGMRGSTVIAGSADIVLLLRSSPAPEGRKFIHVSVAKGRAADMPGDFTLLHTFNNTSTKLEPFRPEGGSDWNTLAKIFRLTGDKLKQKLADEGWKKTGNLYTK